MSLGVSDRRNKGKKPFFVQSFVRENHGRWHLQKKKRLEETNDPGREGGIRGLIFDWNVGNTGTYLPKLASAHPPKTKIRSFSFTPSFKKKKQKTTNFLGWSLFSLDLLLPLPWRVFLLLFSAKRSSSFLFPPTFKEIHLLVFSSLSVERCSLFSLPFSVSSSRECALCCHHWAFLHEEREKSLHLTTLQIVPDGSKYPGDILEPSVKLWTKSDFFWRISCRIRISKLKIVVGFEIKPSLTYFRKKEQCEIRDIAIWTSSLHLFLEKDWCSAHKVRIYGKFGWFRREFLKFLPRTI